MRTRRVFLFPPLCVICALCGQSIAFDSAHTGMDSEKISGVKKRLRRTQTLQQLKDLSDKIWGDGASDETIITSIGTEGTSSSAVVNLPKAVFLDIVEDLISELEPDTTSPGRQLFAIADRSRYGTLV